MLKWDPVFGPVEADPGEHPREETFADDEAGRHDLSHSPLMRRQVGGCMIGQRAAGSPSMVFDRVETYQGRHLLDVRFYQDDTLNESLLTGFFAGLLSPGERTAWLMSCYEAMRERGRWPVNLPLEQLLADEEVFIQWGEIQPACPASIQ